ncbi:MAG: aspartic protease [Rhizobiaceae bacterium MnEN-MB40S]|nr:MAG: aspartic protease [Rhizobiaceae bacterium MnEN-MB40S]
MSKILWIVLGALALTLMLLVINHDSGETLGLPNDRFANVVYFGVWAAVASVAILGSGQRLGELARNALIWLVAILLLSAGYMYRHDLEDTAKRLAGGFVPGMAISRVSSDGLAEVVLTKGMDGHFQADVEVDGRRLDMMVDTGASTVVLTWEDAERVGLDVDALRFNSPVQTANGLAMAATVNLDEVSIGSITRRNVRAGVLQSGKLSRSLLGMNFIETLTSFQMSRDQLVLQD